MKMVIMKLILFRKWFTELGRNNEFIQDLSIEVHKPRDLGRRRIFGCLV